jgi:FAD/FMN-containing dehydrogenase
MIPSQVIEEIRHLLGAAHVLDSVALALKNPGVDPHNLAAGWLARPQNTQELQQLVRICAQHEIALVTQGGRTSLSQGATSTPGQLIVSMERFNRIRELNPLSRTAVIEAGVTLAQLDDALAEHQLSMGLDLGARDQATIGGLTATNAGGNEAFRHGCMRERVLGLEVVLANGECLSELHQVRKCNEGFAIERQFIGSEGCLGIITAVSVDLVSRPHYRATALVGIEGYHQAVQCITALRFKSALLAAEVLCEGQARYALERIDALPKTPPAGQVLLLIEFTGISDTEAQATLAATLERLFEDELILDAWLAKNAAERAAFWRVREDWAVDQRYPGGLWYDVSVPIEHIPTYLSQVTANLQQHDPSLQLFVVGHLADGNLHLTVNCDHDIHERYEEIAPLITHSLKSIGGSFSAEHGIGLEKKQTLQRESSAVKQAWMRQLKLFWDPKNLLNPHKVL